MRPDFGQRLKDSKVVQWLLTYLAGAWLILQVVDVLGDQFSWPLGLLRAITITLGFGAPVAVVVAWHHGERGRQRVGAAELTLVSALLVIAGVAVAVLAPQPDPPPDDDARSGDVPSIAVLPFEHRSGDEGDEFFTAGIHDEVLTRIYDVGGIRVVSRTSVEAYRDTDKTVPEIASELGVKYVLEGAVQRAGGRVRITAQLLDGLRDEHLWAQTFDRVTTVENLLDVQTEIATAIASTLGARLGGDEPFVPAGQPTDNLAAYEAYVRAQAVAGGGDLESYLRAIELYEQAVAADPEFALAWAAMSRLRTAVYFTNVGFRDELVRALDDLLQAEALAPDADFTRVARASYIFRGELDYERAIEQLDAVRGLDPSAMGFRAAILWRMGRWEESLELHYDRLLVDPRNPTAYQTLGRRLFELRRYDEALTYLDGAQELAPARPQPPLLTFASRLEIEGDTVGMDQWAAELDHPQVSAWVAYFRRDFGAARTLSPPPLGSTFTRWTQWAPGLVFDESVRLAYADSLSVGGEQRMSDVYRDRGPPDLFVKADGHVALGFSAALRGDTTEAVDQASQAMQAIPIAADGLFGALIQRGAMNILIAVGEYGQALDLLEELLAMPSDLASAWLKFDPFFDPLRTEPRFQQLVRVPN